MTSLKITLLATALIGAGVLTAAAQSGSGGSMQPSSPGAASNQNISPATHCKTASGQVQLKSAAAGGASTGSASGTSGMGSSSGASGSTSGSSSISGVSPSIVATLPSC
jgi:hypothetical protein